MRLVGAAIIAALTLLAVACGGDDTSVLEAADALEPPASFTEDAADTNNSFDSVTRTLTFTTELSQNDACEAARDALASWAGQALPEPRTALPRNICSYELSNPANHDGVDLAVARVFRAKVGEDFVEDGDAAGGVEEITIFFRTNK